MAHGIHHVTAITGPARRSLAFHTRALGQRLVKTTVNFDDPSTYHLYYGDTAGSPGSILTVFPWEHAARGLLGTGETRETAFRIPKRSIGYWARRLAERDVAFDAPDERFGEPVLSFTDPDGLRLAMVGVEGAEHESHWASDGIPAEHAIRGLHGVTLLLAASAPTAAILTDVLGFAETGTDGGTSRFAAAGVTLGGVVDLKVEADLPRGRQGAGSVHHVAFRAADDAAQVAMARRLREDFGILTTEQRDRTYFRSVYFREPGGLIFEIATDAPGFAVDEPEDRLGQSLKLPSAIEPRRAEIEAVLPVLTP